MLQNTMAIGTSNPNVITLLQLLLQLHSKGGNLKSITRLLHVLCLRRPERIEISNSLHPFESTTGKYRNIDISI